MAARFRYVCYVLLAWATSREVAWAQQERPGGSWTLSGTIGAHLLQSIPETRGPTDLFVHSLNQGVALEGSLGYNWPGGLYANSYLQLLPFDATEKGKPELIDLMEDNFEEALLFTPNSFSDRLQTSVPVVFGVGFGYDLRLGQWSILSNVGVANYHVRFDTASINFKLQDANDQFNISYTPSEQSTNSALFKAGLDIEWRPEPTVGFVLRAQALRYRPEVSYLTVVHNELSGESTETVSTYDDVRITGVVSIGMTLHFARGGSGGAVGSLPDSDKRAARQQRWGVRETDTTPPPTFEPSAEERQRYRERGDPSSWPDPNKRAARMRRYRESSLFGPGLGRPPGRGPQPEPEPD